METRKIVKSILLALGVYALFWISSNRQDLKNFPGIISSFYSKEMCSCVFVAGQTEEFCNNYARQWVPIQGTAMVDREKKTITVKGLFKTSVAAYGNERSGCVLKTTE
ncbi:MAG: hypothetical protein K8S54_14875 [Spirochaetia bacterium]|nr:hypothetical protein [Spirochaetia bacterium]